MTDFDATPQTPRPWRAEDYDDPHYHDEDETPAVDEARPRTPRPSSGRTLPPPRRYHEDD